MSDETPTSDNTVKYACITGAVAGSVGLLLIWWNRNKFRKTKSKKGKKTKSPVSGDGGKRKKKSKKSKLPPSPQLLERIANSMKELQRSGELGGDCVKLLEFMKEIEPSQVPAEVSLAGAQWLVLRNTVQQMRTPANLRGALELSSKADMEIAWKLLQVDANNPVEVRAVDILRLDVAQRLQAPGRLLKCYTKVVKRGDQMSHEEILVTFTTAPLLGKWSDVAWLGQQVQNQQNSLDDFHLASIQDKSLPDYKVLHDLSRSEEPEIQEVLEAVKTDCLFWATRPLKSFRIKASSVDCEDEQKAADMKEKLDQTGEENKWQDVPPGRYALKIEGGLCSMVGVTEYGLRLCGPYTQNHIYLKNYVDLRMQDGGTLKQIETYDLKRQREADDDLWKGYYRLDQKRSDKPDGVSMTFEMEIVLAPILGGTTTTSG